MFDVGYCIVGVIVGVKGWFVDIDGIGVVFDGFDVEIGVFGWGEEFEGVLGVGYGVLVGKMWSKFDKIEFV